MAYTKKVVFEPITNRYSKMQFRITGVRRVITGAVVNFKYTKTIEAAFSDAVKNSECDTEFI